MTLTTTRPRRNALLNQKGAMFGLDARIAMAIMAALSVIAGVALISAVKDFKKDALHSTVTRIAAAVDDLQADLHSYPEAALTSDTPANAYTALYDSSVLTATYAPRWNGPYIRESISANREYGAMKLYLLADNDYSNDDCSTITKLRACSLWLFFEKVPLHTIEQYNKDVDGTGETNPESEGQVAWDTPDAGNNYNLYVRITKAVPPGQ